MKFRFLILLLCSYFCLISSLFAGGKLKTKVFEENFDTSGLKIRTPRNWQVTDPQVVVALGYLQPKLFKKYEKYALDRLILKFNKMNPDIRVVVISATAKTTIDALRNPNTVGFIFLSHTFETHLKTALLLGADQHPMPVDLLSAATPSLRFVGFLGCHGESILKEYQVNYELGQLPGNHVFFYNSNRYLSAGFFGIDQVKTMIRKIAHAVRDSQLVTRDALRSGVPIPSQEMQGKLEIRVKDVNVGVEPRYVEVNHHIVGVLGADATTSNDDDGYRTFQFTVPNFAFKQGKVQRVTIRSANLTSGAAVDDYLMNAVSLSGPQGVLLGKHNYDPEWRLGRKESSFRGSEKTLFKGRFYLGEFDSLPLTPISADPVKDGGLVDFWEH